MASFREQIRDWRRFWGEVVGMWRKEHGFTISLLWKLSPWLTLIGIIGIFTLPEPWKTISWALFGIGIFDLVFSLCFVFPYRKWRRDLDMMNQSNTESLSALTEQIKNLNPLKALEREQRGNEGEWLCLVVEYFDLGRHTNRPEKEIRVLFQIDSGLVYDIQPYRMWVSPILGGWEASEPEYEIRQPPNLLKGKRSQLSSIDIPIKDEKLWESVKEIRQGKDITKALKVELQLETGKSPIVLRSYGLYPDRVNDTRQ